MTEIQEVMPMMDTGLIGMHGRSQCSGTFACFSDNMHFLILFFSDQVNDHIFVVKEKRVIKQWVNPKIGTMRLSNKC